MKPIITGALCLLLLAGCAAPRQDADATTASTSLPETTAPTTLTETSAPTEAPTIAESITFTLYTPNEMLEGFDETESVIDELSAQNIIQLLIDAGVLNEGITVISETVEDGNVQIDLNEAFGEQLNSFGSTGERYYIGSVVNSILSAYGAQSVTITVDGQVLESGHVVYDFPIEFLS